MKSGHEFGPYDMHFLRQILLGKRSLLELGFFQPFFVIKLATFQYVATIFWFKLNLQFNSMGEKISEIYACEMQHHYAILLLIGALL